MTDDACYASREELRFTPRWRVTCWDIVHGDGGKKAVELCGAVSIAVEYALSVAIHDQVSHSTSVTRADAPARPLIVAPLPASPARRALHLTLCINLLRMGGTFLLHLINAGEHPSSATLTVNSSKLLWL